MTVAVSIVMPAYNAAAYIGAALASVAAQMLVDFELLVVDDASTDGTATLVEAFGDPRVRLIRQAVNAGPAAARNRGIELAQGRWIALLDADDSYAPDRLERLVAAAEADGADLCSDNLLLVPALAPDTAAPMIPPDLLSEPRRLGIEEFHHRNVADPAWPGVNYGFLKPILRRDFLAAHRIRYDERVRFAEDFGLYLDCLYSGGKWLMIPEATYHYTVRGDSLTQIQTPHDLAVLAARLGAAAATAPPELRRTIARHRRVVDRCLYYREFTDLVKAKQPLAALRRFAETPATAMLITGEAIRQLPVITRKAFRGGYR